MNSTGIESIKKIELPRSDYFNSTSMALDSTGRKMYFANYDQNSISFFDANTNNTKIEIFSEGLLHPFDLAVNPMLDEVFITTGLNTVIVVNGRTLERIGFPIPVGLSPTAITIDPKTGTVFVANNGDNTVSIIDGTTHKPIGNPIPVGLYLLQSP